MFKHFLLIVPDHRHGRRMGWHKLITSSHDYSDIKSVVKKIAGEAGDTQLASHIIVTDSIEISSIKNKDPFFSDVLFFENEDEFIDSYKNEKELTANDVANYILSIGQDITHLKLQKLLYLCYENVLKRLNFKLFDDYIYAYDYGPVIDSVYHRYKNGGKRKLDIEEDNSIYISESDSLITPSLSRILFSKNGINTLKIIDDTLDDYINYSAGELVKITHEKGTAWSNTYIAGKKFNEITDESILESI
ncbi:Panacea domain-containing protein [Staphylococcus simulans]|uniref:Panacea domain-containing protein n=1 Tax=Staphylococcus simulans TaxID=1286 RepID=UPI003999F584